MDKATQQTKILNLLKANPAGVPNYTFPRHGILKYSSRISELRQDGYNIFCVRDRLPNGKVTNVFRYFLNDQPEQHKKSLLDRIKRKRG